MKLVTLIVYQGWEQNCDEVQPIFSCEDIKAGSTAPSLVDDSSFPVKSGLDLCTPSYKMQPMSLLQEYWAF